MGIAKWRLLNTEKGEKEKVKVLSEDVSTKEDEMEVAYAHVRYQKSFDAEEEKLHEEKYQEMKKQRKMMLKPLKSMGIKKFSKQYEDIKKELIVQKKNKRLKSENHSEYKPPPLTKFAQVVFKEESDTKKLEEIKEREKLNARNKREKYWMLVRDLHPPNVSRIKQKEMRNLISQTSNPRLWRNGKRESRNTNSTKHDSERDTSIANYFSHALRKDNKLRKSTEYLTTTQKVGKKKNVRKKRNKAISEHFDTSVHHVNKK